MNVASLPKARALAESQTVDSVLQIIVRSLAEQSHVAQARLWLYLVASAGNSLNTALYYRPLLELANRLHSAQLCCAENDPKLRNKAYQPERKMYV